MRSSAGVVAILLVARCATPDESLVWSAELARALPRESGDVVEVARFSRSPPGAIGKPWEPYLVLHGDDGSRRRSFYGDITFRSDK